MCNERETAEQKILSTFNEIDFHYQNSNFDDLKFRSWLVYSDTCRNWKISTICRRLFFFFNSLEVYVVEKWIMLTKMMLINIRILISVPLRHLHPSSCSIYHRLISSSEAFSSLVIMITRKNSHRSIFQVVFRV